MPHAHAGKPSDYQSYIARKARIQSPLDMLLWLLDKIIRRWKTEGPLAIIGHILRQSRRRLLDQYLLEPFHDWRLGIKTCKPTTRAELGLPDQQYNFYKATAYRDFKRAMKYLTLRPNHDVFIDIGAGKGRVLIMAARYPFKRVIGLEYAQDLTLLARQNIQNAQKKLACSNIDVITGDAARFIIPPDVTVVHLNNPFNGQILHQALQRLQESINANPRPVTMLFKDPVFLEPMLHQFPWIKPRAEFYFYYDYKYAIYDCLPDAPADPAESP